MSCVHGGYQMTDVHGVKGSPENAQSPKPDHERSVATARARPGPPCLLGPPSARSGLHSCLRWCSEDYTGFGATGALVRHRLGAAGAGAAGARAVSAMAPGLVALTPRCPAAAMARSRRARRGSRRARGAPTARVRRRGAPPDPRARRGRRRQGICAPGRRLRGVLRRLLRRLDPRQAEGHLADGGRAHLRLGCPGREGRPHRRTVRQAPVFGDRARRGSRAAGVPGPHHQRRCADSVRRGYPIPGACWLPTISRPRR